MKKLNKKGFTLVEMLVVIAIIAVLVAIIIPTTSSATTKAAAATNAANLRSVLAEATTDYLAGTEDTSGFVEYHPDATGDGKFVVTSTAPVSKKCGTIYNSEKETITVKLNSDNTISVYFGTTATHDITYFSTIADTGKEPTSST